MTAAKINAIGGLDEYIEGALAERKIPGAAVAVVLNDEVLYAKGFGVKEYGGSAPIDERTLFQIGSTSKAFTSAALGILVDEGAIRWDDPVISYLPDFQLHDPWLTRNLTIRDTVAHRSGYALAPLDLSAVMEIIDSDEVLRRMRHPESFAPFRDSYLYSNHMYGVAGKVLEAASEMTWGEFLKRRLLQPLKMTRSGTSPYEFWDAKDVAPVFLGTAPGGKVCRESARDSNVAMPHVLQEGITQVLPWQSYDNMAGAGSVVSNVSEVANWLILHLNDGQFQGSQILKATTVAELHSPQNLRGTCGFPFDVGSGSHAMGWRRETYRGKTHLAHGGGILGFPSYVAMLPDSKIGVVVLANSQAAEPDDWMHTLNFNESTSLWIFDRILGDPVYDWGKKYLRLAREARQRNEMAETELQNGRIPDTRPFLSLTALAGVYTDKSGTYGPLHVDVEAEKLRVHFSGAGAFSATLEHWHFTTFRVVPNGFPSLRSFVEFSINPNGNVISMSAFGSEFTRAVP